MGQGEWVAQSTAGLRNLPDRCAPAASASRSATLSSGAAGLPRAGAAGDAVPRRLPRLDLGGLLLTPVTQSRAPTPVIVLLRPYSKHTHTEPAEFIRPEYVHTHQPTALAQRSRTSARRDADTAVRPPPCTLRQVGIPSRQCAHCPRAQLRPKMSQVVCSRHFPMASRPRSKSPSG